MPKLIDLDRELLGTDFTSFLRERTSACPQCGRGEEAGDVMTVRAVCKRALLADDAREKDLTPESKLDRFDLARAIHKAEAELELTNEQARVLKERIGALYGALVVGQAFACFDSSKEGSDEQ